ncbi:hypothetical protein V3C99_013812 [Haemonchus contortus]|uniref:Transposase n=1 Tax=Haemonchus contortus TaxID=6289 RepID=A0A7I4YT40_HAECO
MEMNALYEKLDRREGEKFVFRLAKARQRATQDIGVVKSVRNSEGAILGKSGIGGRNTSTGSSTKNSPVKTAPTWRQRLAPSNSGQRVKCI